MTQDMVRSVRKTNRGNSQIPTWVWFLTGFVSGFFVAFLFYLDGFVISDPDANLTTVFPEMPVEADQVEEMKWDFYEIFPTAEVPVVEEFTKEGNKIQVEDPVAYLLQAGSFKNQKDADQLRGRLLLMGLNVFSREVEVQGSKWHRVLIGPLNSLAELNRDRQVLAREQIESIPLKVKRTP